MFQNSRTPTVHRKTPDRPYVFCITKCQNIVHESRFKTASNLSDPRGPIRDMQLR